KGGLMRDGEGAGGEFGKGAALEKNKPLEEEESDSDESFKDLLSRVIPAMPSLPHPSPTTSHNDKGKQKETVEETPALLSGRAGDEEDEHEDDEDEEEADGELVGREEGQVDATDLLREQLRKTGDRGEKGGRGKEERVLGEFSRDG
ncbi:hypothetical protein P7C70_g9389, partial [Phenoliferia sp. Uapishka_3]